MPLNYYFDEIEGGGDVTHEWQEWDVTRHGDFDEWPEDQRRGEGDEREVFAQSALTTALIFNSISIGIDHITADNAAEVFARTKIIGKFHGDLVMYADPNKRFILEPEHITQYIGLRTNVSYETREEWVQRFFIGDGDELSSNGLKRVPMDEDEKYAFDRRPDVSFTSGFTNDYRKSLRKKAKAKT